MPTLEGDFDDLVTLFGRPLQPEEMDHILDAVKGEWKHFDPETRRFKIELNDTNRPDLWSVEGIARQLRGGSALPGRPYDFLEKAEKRRAGAGAPDIRVDSSVLPVRPVLGGFVARGGRLGEEGLAQLIGTQERLSELFGRKRSDLAIGVYPFKRITFPLTFRTSDPSSTRFVPLGHDESLSLREIVDSHPKGIAYGGLVSSHPSWPVLVDDRGEILSFPPIVNGRSTGEVMPEDESLFVEATGYDSSRILLVLNILAANLADRGYRIDPLLVSGEVDLVAPADIGTVVSVPEGLPAEILGIESDPRDFVETLLSYGYTQISRYEAEGKGDWKVLSPFYRDDLLGAVDVVEDYLMARGYDSFDPIMPSSFTKGRASSRQKIELRLRQAMMGMGYVELLSNILTGESQVASRLGRSGEGLVCIDNPASLQFAVVRPTLLSGLLSAESRSSRFPYPHRVFEVGEAMVLEENIEGGKERRVRDRWLLAAILSHPTASVSELQGVLEFLFERMDRSLAIKSVELSPFLPGRSGVYVNSQGVQVACIGEIHPKFLDIWGIRMPSVCFEVDVEFLLAP